VLLQKWASDVQMQATDKKQMRYARMQYALRDATIKNLRDASVRRMNHPKLWAPSFTRSIHIKAYRIDTMG
jgi:hypothetical protein